jgi:hypothetical protein
MSLLKKYNLWMGLHKDHQWVILDRNFPANNDGWGGNRKLYFVKCSDWSVFTDLHSNWISPNYMYVVSYLEDLKKNEPELFEKNIVHEENAIKYLKTYIKEKKSKIQFEFLTTIHNDYLTKKGLAPRLLVKTKLGKRRTSHCWNCKDSVDNTIDYECEKCKWIVCASCGACKKENCE